jgi:hypothetical protein
MKRLSKLRVMAFLFGFLFVITGSFAQSTAESAAQDEKLKEVVSAVLQAQKLAEITSQKSVEAVSWVPAPPWLLYLLVAIILVGMAVVVNWIRSGLVKSVWSLSDALSEEVALPIYKESVDASGKLVKDQIFDSDHKAVLAPQLRGSTSRLIALMGMVAILILFVCFGAVGVYAFGQTGTLPNGIEKVVGFLMTGTALFAPYALNKLLSVFQTGVGGK